MIALVGRRQVGGHLQVGGQLRDQAELSVAAWIGARLNASTVSRRPLTSTPPWRVWTIASRRFKNSAIWKNCPVNFSSYGITGSPAGPTAAPMGRVAAEASVATAVGSDVTTPVESEGLVLVVSVGSVEVELVDVEVVEVDGAGADEVARPAASARSID